ncbi:calcineurin-like phosphoesterase [Xylaria bambusicola]|uniref:calcineurin-like phosphoesterase n=1 Tax=Xylaria bambusicola TaxID=326684 RepID=UPI0020076D34|nr:calcineurin-like phosphoesterase [Xylaria bambusicola]KAI0523679.1 calcineurin-like phosphoesterase [Xylaria bambusicola]
MGLLVKVGLRRRMKWEPRTALDWFLESPLQGIIYLLYPVILWLRGNPVRPPKNKAPIKVVFLSDTHDSVVQKVPDGDLLIHCGDMTNDGTAASIQKQIDWLASLPHQHKVLVCGNHDSWFDLNSRTEEDTLGHRTVDLKTLHYLERSSITLSFKDNRKLNIYGAPDLPQCGGSEMAFQYTIDQHPWKGTIPFDTDILVTHTPPMLHRDLSLGCPGLLAEIWRKKPKVHVFGHVHCGRGLEAVYWDDCQKAYEDLMLRRKRGPLYDMIPNPGWIGAFRVLYHAAKGILWQWFWLGGMSNGSILINAAMQAGTSGKLTDRPPFTIEI